MDDKKLKDILEKHRKWLNDEEDGECADLSYANLEDTNLSYTNLSFVNLSFANLRHTNLSYTNLSFVNLNFANLRHTNLSYANLEDTDLSHANLEDTDLSHANLKGANLSYTDLRSTNLSYTDLRGSDLSNIIVDNFTTGYFLACPEKGSFIGFKKVGSYIIELEIPENAKRSSATTRKCRCEFAKVLSITNLDGSDSGLTEVVNRSYKRTIYKISEMVYPDSFDENRWNECSNGIHFFITREEAVLY